MGDLVDVMLGTGYFPSFLEGLSLRPVEKPVLPSIYMVFPFLLGGAFIEAAVRRLFIESAWDFPSFLEGLSLRRFFGGWLRRWILRFPFLLGGAFIEAAWRGLKDSKLLKFPFLLGGAFIEAT